VRKVAAVVFQHVETLIFDFRAGPREGRHLRHVVSRKRQTGHKSAIVSRSSTTRLIRQRRGPAEFLEQEARERAEAKAKMAKRCAEQERTGKNKSPIRSRLNRMSPPQRNFTDPESHITHIPQEPAEGKASCRMEPTKAALCRAITCRSRSIPRRRSSWPLRLREKLG
jgi:hypothetical protein